MAKMWAGRTSGVTDSIADDFNSSIHFDCKMYKQDITGSMAHAAMLGAKNIISKKEADILIDGITVK
jgi:argininosuccinate lyase